MRIRDVRKERKNVEHFAEKFSKCLERYNDTLTLNIEREFGIYKISYKAILKDLFALPFNNLVFIFNNGNIDIHLNPKGHDKIIELLSGSIKDYEAETGTEVVITIELED